MLHTRVFEVVAQFVVNLVNAAFDRTYDASSAYYGRKTHQVDTLVPQRLLYKPLAPAILVEKVRKTLKFFAAVFYRLFEKQIAVVINSNFCRS